MKYVPFGNTGLSVSVITLGCMSYGDAASGTHPWTLDESTSRAFIEQALERGYQRVRHGERVLGRYERGDPRPGDRAT